MSKFKGISFSESAFWRLAAVAFAFEVLHAILAIYWPEIRGSRLGPRPISARCFMLLEVALFSLAVIAGLGNAERMLKLPVRPVGKISAVILVVLVLVGTLLLVWDV